jgi:hypothetical protein
MTKIWYDCEFIEDGRTIDLISIGMVDEIGRSLYLINGDNDIISRAYEHPWLQENVIPSLPVKLSGVGMFWEWDHSHPDWPCVVPVLAPAGVDKDRFSIAGTVASFIQTAPDPELWAYYGAYDHVVLCQLWGPMIDLPEGIPMWTNDIKQECMRLGNPRLPQQLSGEHNALNDARHNRAMHQFLIAQDIRLTTQLIERHTAQRTIKDNPQA